MEVTNTTQTELHTHLMGMLSARGFLTLLDVYDAKVYMDEKDNIVSKDDAFINYSAKEILECDMLYKKFINQISIKKGTHLPYDNLDTLYEKRNYIMQSLVQEYFEDVKPSSQQDARATIYSSYLNLALLELQTQGVKHVDISFSNPKLINYFELNNTFKDIKINFLLSTNRQRTPDQIYDQTKNLKKIVHKDFTIGFDLMGAESGISKDEEKDLKIKFKYILDKLTLIPNSILRIHSGETPQSKYNTKIILKMLDKLIDENSYDISTLEIRIGHGTHVEKDDELIKLLKKFNCSVEINASSNIALENILNFDELSHNFYLENNIPVYICTDGHGLYDTTINNENRIIQHTTTKEFFLKILETDNKKVRGL